MNRFVRASLFSIAGLALAAVLSSCSEISSGGGSTSIPQIVVNCTSSSCSAVSSPIVHVLITSYDCSAVSDQFAVASSSISINCTPGAGCYGVTSSWVNSSGTINTIPSGTYTICGRIDYNRNYPGVTSDDTMSVKLAVNISSSSSGPVNLTSWTDP